ncbi:MAG: inorganic pyrophosphatase Ppa [Thermodesulfobacteriota bacterium]|nr:inorganic pyrophosphatase Ppa [Thermodesulfobacteriota bacterium]
MPIKNIPQEGRRFEIQAYKRPKDLKELRKTHVPFSGSPLKHPYEPKKVILVPDPYRSNPSYYEFNSGDISFLEELPNIVDLDGEIVKMVRIWVKKMSVGMLCTPFFIEETQRVTE